MTVTQADVGTLWEELTTRVGAGDRFAGLSGRRPEGGPLVLFAKVMFIAFLMFWARFTYPRLREDQLQSLAWKWLIPIALLNILVTGVLKVAF